MIDFREALDQLCAAQPGAISATIMGVDGIPIDTVEPGLHQTQAEVPSLMVEYSSLLKQVRSSAQMFEAGDLRELCICSEHLQTLVRPINEEYFLALSVNKDAGLGKARYLLRVLAPQMLEALA